MAKKKQRSARSYKLGAQKAAASRQINKLKKELEAVNNTNFKEVKHQYGKAKKSTVQNELLVKIMRINTDYLNPINKKLARFKTKKQKQKEQRKEEKENKMVRNFNGVKEGEFFVWEKAKLEKFIKKNWGQISTINNLNIEKDFDKVQAKIDTIFSNMDSGTACVLQWSADDDTKWMIFKQDAENEDNEEYFDEE